MSINKITSKYKSLPVQVKAAFWFLICSFLQKGISVITTPIFTRLLSTEDYGKYNIFNSWYGIIAIIVSMNLSYGVYAQGLIKFKEESYTFSSSLQGLTFVLSFLWTGIYLVFNDFWNNLFNLSTIQMICMMIMIWTSAVFSFWVTEQRVKYAYKKLVSVTLIVSVVMPMLEILLVIKMHDKVIARILGIAIVQLVLYFWMFIIQLKNGKQFYSKKFWVYALSYNLPLIPHYLSQIVLNNSDRIMIGKMVGDSEAGIYSLAYSVALIMTLFNSALLQTITPWLYQKIKERKEKEIAPIAYVSLLLIAIVNILLILFAPEVISIFAPNSYSEAIWVVPPVAMSVFFMYAYDLFAKFAFYYEKTRFIMIASVIGAVLNIILNYIFIGKFGYLAAGYTTLVCFITYTGMHYFFMKKVCLEFCGNRNPYQTKELLEITLSFIIICFVLLFTYRFPIIRYGIATVLILLAIINRRKLIGQIMKIWTIRGRT